MLFVPINAESESALDEKNVKTFEQQQAEIARFEELKQCYQSAVDAVKHCQYLDAERILFNLFDTEIFTIRTFDGKQLQRAVMKLILSMPPHSRHLEVCLKALDVFPDEKYFLQKLARFLMRAGRFDDASDVYEILYRTEPLNPDYLAALAESLKQAGNFVKLDDLKARLVKNGMMIVDEALFDWKSQLANLSPLQNEMVVDSGNELPVLHLPMKDVNWTNYAHILFSMATSNYSAVFKKVHFDATPYAVLAGPCVFDMNSSAASQAQTQTQAQTQSVLLSSVQEYLTSSMEDIGSAGESQSKRRSTTRKRETKLSNSCKCELCPADFIKNISQLMQVEEAAVIEGLCSTESAAIALLDKNNFAGPVDEATGPGLFTPESLRALIDAANQTQQSILQRIFELLRYFFVDALGQAFPPALGQQMFHLSQLVHDSIISWDNLKDFFGDDFYKYCLGAAELRIDLEPTSRQCFEWLWLKSFPVSQEPDYSRFKILEALFSDNKAASLNNLQLSTPIPSRYFKCLPHLATQQSIQVLLNASEQLSNLDDAEALLASNAAAADEVLAKLEAISIQSVNGMNRLRLGRILLKTGAELDASLAELLVRELFDCAAAIDVSLFTEVLNLLLDLCMLSHSAQLNLLCLFWNLFSRRHLISNGSSASLSACFVRVLNSALVPSNTEVYTFLLNWLAQEKCFGSAHAAVPHSIFRLLCREKDFTARLMAYSIAFSLWRFPSVFASHEALIEEWDRHPIGTKELQSLPITFADLNLLCDLLWSLIEAVDNEKVETKLVVSDPNTVSCIDWLKTAFSSLAKDAAYLREFGHAFELNRSQIRHFLSSPLDLHATASVAKPRHFHVASLQSLRILLNFRSDIVHAELQGRKKSFETLKTLRFDLKTSLSIQGDDAEVWALLGTCYYDALVHYLSSEAEFLTAQQGKLKRTLKKAILCFQLSLRLQQNNHEAWAKLSDLCDWALHYPSQLSTNGDAGCVWICSLGCRAVQFLLPRIAARDIWQQLLRLEMFLRRSNKERDASKLLVLLKQAVIAACKSYCENVYESTALYNSLAKFYSRLGKSGNEQTISEGLQEISSYLPSIVKPETPSLLAHLDALNALDRKKIFHSHFMTSAWLAWRSLNDSQAAVGYLSSIFPFLKANKRVAQSLCQIYQSDHDRPARFLACTRRYLMRLIAFIADSDAFDDKLQLLATVLKKLHYVRKTILGFPELLLAATQAYFTVADAELSSPECNNRQDILDILHELLESLQAANVRVPDSLYDQLAKHSDNTGDADEAEENFNIENSENNSNIENNLNEFHENNSQMME